MQISFSLNPYTLRVLLGLLLMAASLCKAQIPITWKDLSAVTYEYAYDDFRNAFASNPTFSNKIKALEGKDIEIKGHVLPTDIQGKMIVLSEYPFSSCFFCGGAGQESVMELRMRKNKSRFKPDEVRTFRGTLRLGDDPYGLSYILEDAELVN